VKWPFYGFRYGRCSHAPQIQQEITIYVDKDGRSYLMNQEIPLDLLFKRLKEMIGEQEDRLVVVKADRSVILNKVVKVMDVARNPSRMRFQ
jgi:biopolymer transport protein ExbD